MKFMLLSVLAAFCLYWIKNFVYKIFAETYFEEYLWGQLEENHPILLCLGGLWFCSLVVAVISIVRFIILM